MYVDGQTHNCPIFSSHFQNYLRNKVHEMKIKRLFLLLYSWLGNIILFCSHFALHHVRYWLEEFVSLWGTWDKENESSQQKFINLMRYNNINNHRQQKISSLCVTRDIIPKLPQHIISTWFQIIRK